jgi:tetratricopeptide (TPR) repeat protein
MSKEVNKREKELEVDQILSRSEQFIEKHKRNLLYGLIGVAAVAGLILAYHYGYALPRSAKAELSIIKGERYFGIDSFRLALEGDGLDYEGFETIIDRYGSTKTGNLAYAYAGICHYKLGDPATAIKRLKSYSGHDANMAPALTGLIGDCYVSLGDVKAGIPYFEKAASKADNEVISPIYLKKAGIAYESLGEYGKAIKVYTAIKEKYNRSTEAQDIEKYIRRSEILSKK